MITRKEIGKEHKVYRHNGDEYSMNSRNTAAENIETENERTYRKHYKQINRRMSMNAT